MTATNSYDSIRWQDLTATDLRAEAAAAEAEVYEHFNYRTLLADMPVAIRLNDGNQTPEALWIPRAGRVGIANGADADWADCNSEAEMLSLLETALVTV